MGRNNKKRDVAAGQERAQASAGRHATEKNIAPEQTQQVATRSSFGMKLLMTLVCLAVVAYFGIQTYQSLVGSMMTTMAYSYQVEDTISVTGYVARQEQVLPDSGDGLLRLTRSEGERVSAGGKIAQTYSDQATLDLQTQIDQLQTQLNQLEFAAEAASANEVSLQLDSQIVERLMEMRRAVTAGRMDAVEGSVKELKDLVLRRDYTYTDAEDLTSQTAEIKAQLKTLQRQSGSSVRAITAPRSGIYSAVADGFEAILTPEALESLTPSDLSKLQPQEVTTDLGKLVLGDKWYYVASLSAAEAEQLTEDGKETLRFAKGVDRDLRVTVQSVGEEENGRVAVVLRGDTFLPQLTLLRQQSADIIRNSVTGIRVPQQAIRVDDKGVTGVFCVVGAAARFKPVRVLWSDDGYALVRPDGTKEMTLRPGDQVILTTSGLTDGTVVG